MHATKVILSTSTQVLKEHLGVSSTFRPRQLKTSHDYFNHLMKNPGCIPNHLKTFESCVDF